MGEIITELLIKVTIIVLALSCCCTFMAIITSVVLFIILPIFKVCPLLGIATLIIFFIVKVFVLAEILDSTEF